MVDELSKLAVRIKVVSAILAGGALGWGAVLLLMFSPKAVGSLFFFPGYAITIWYFVRTFSQPNFYIRELMWVFSLIIQGLWCLFGLAMIGDLFGMFTETWWVFATAASAWALWAEATLTPLPVSIHHSGEDSAPSKNSQN
ncbi:MAG TPA: hypothetical protein VGJ04_02675 [Pirellulales bacterium]|jgi:hypothetical protein